MKKTVLQINGMSCQHCVMRVKKVFSGLPGIETSSVEVGSAELTFDESRITQEDIEKAVSAAGYSIKR